MMLDCVKLLGHASIKISNGNTTIYIDPFNIDNNYNDADVIFVTHNHYDHYSYKDILKVIKNDTVIVVPQDLVGVVSEYATVIGVEPNEEYVVNNIEFSTVYSYNVGKKFHSKENNWVGYIIEFNNIKYYIAGDTDFNEDIKSVCCDVAFVPVGGTYTMNSIEAAEFINFIEPKVAVPIHYGSIVGSVDDAIDFGKKVNAGIDVFL